MADAPASGAGVRKGVGVQVPPRAHSAGLSSGSIGLSSEANAAVRASGFAPLLSFRGGVVATAAGPSEATVRPPLFGLEAPVDVVVGP